MRRKKADPDVKAKAEWHKAREKVGVVDVDDYVMDMSITDGTGTLDQIQWFVDAFEYWEKLFLQFWRPVSVSIRYGYAGCLLRS
jgi:hypothetical protein